MNWLVIRTNKYYIFSWVEGDSDISLGYGGLGNRRDVDSSTGWRRVVIDLLGCSRDVSGLARLSDLDIGGETCSDRRMVDWLFNEARSENLSPRMRRARSMSFFISVTLLAWMALSCASSKRPVRYYDDKIVLMPEGLDIWPLSLSMLMSRVAHIF